MNNSNFDAPINYLQKIPAIKQPIASGTSDNGLWWVKFKIDIAHSLAWQVVQEIGHVVNYLSLNERLPTTFYPVSPAPYMNGGAKEFLSWVIEASATDFTPDELKEWLEGRLPKPVDNLDEWMTDNDELVVFQVNNVGNL
jgi:hypothetical protein